MFFNCILLALTVSIDSLGIGITYGIKNTKIPKTNNIILFAISFCTTFSSIFLGHYISVLFSPNISTFLGSSFLIILGIYNIFKILNETHTNYDIDNSNFIDKKEALLLGLALSADSICIGIGCGAIGFNDIILPVLVAIFQLLFLNYGNAIAKKIIYKFHISTNTLSIFSAVILIFVGVLRIIF